MDDFKIVEVGLPGDARLLVRAENVGGAASGPADVGLRDLLSFTSVINSIRGLAAELHKGLQAASPDAVTVDLGFDLAVKGSQVLALVADGGAKASIRVRLEWHSDGHSAAPADNSDTESDDAVFAPAES
jgi:Trypsin-co-occurring domain 1